MKFFLFSKVEVDVAFLKASCGVRYWENASVDGVVDELGDLIPCRVGDRWEPLIAVETGKIQNWQVGKTASIHYKVCDDGEYSLLDQDMNCLMKTEDYVPSIMSPKENGWGDYVIMDIRADGTIADWQVDHVKKIIDKPDERFGMGKVGI